METLHQIIAGGGYIAPVISETCISVERGFASTTYDGMDGDFGIDGYQDGSQI